MTRPDSVNGPSGSPTQQWAWPASSPGQQFTSPAPAVQPPYPAYPQQQSYQQQSYQQQHYPPHQQTYPQHPGYANSWGQQGGPFPPAPLPAATRHRTGPSTGKIFAFALAGILMIGLLGAAAMLVTGNRTIPGLTPSAAPAATAVTMSLPPVVDGHPLIDNESSRQLVDAAKQQLAAVSANPVVGMYGDPGQLPAFVIVAGTTTAGSPDQVLTGMAAGFQQSLGSQELNFVDQPAGPLGGTMRCAEHAPMTTCMWTVDGAFGMNMVFQQDLAQAAATTLKVRDAIETHTS
jgi:hypothetical protein